MVHHSCYLNISFEADRLLFFWVLGRLPCPLRGASRRVLFALSQQLRSSRSAEPVVAECCPDLRIASQDHLQAHALHLRGARHA